MNNTEKSKVYQKIINNVFCTKKGIKALETDDYTLGKRERQFLLLLTNNDNISRQLRIGLAPKIDIEIMLNQGFIDCTIAKERFLQYLYENRDETDFLELGEHYNPEESKIKIARKDGDTSANVVINEFSDSDEVNPPPDVMIAAGIFL